MFVGVFACGSFRINSTRAQGLMPQKHLKKWLGVRMLARRHSLKWSLCKVNTVQVTTSFRGEQGVDFVQPLFFCQSWETHSWKMNHPGGSNFACWHINSMKQNQHKIVLCWVSSTDSQFSKQPVQPPNHLMTYNPQYTLKIFFYCFQQTEYYLLIIIC